MPQVLGPVFVLMCVLAWGTQPIVLLILMCTVFFIVNIHYFHITKCLPLQNFTNCKYLLQFTHRLLVRFTISTLKLMSSVIHVKFPL